MADRQTALDALQAGVDGPFFPRARPPAPRRPWPGWWSVWFPPSSARPGAV